MVRSAVAGCPTNLALIAYSLPGTATLKSALPVDVPAPPLVVIVFVTDCISLGVGEDHD